MEDNKIIIQFPNKVAVLVVTPFTTEIDTDDLTKIHYYNIIGEILVAPVLLNRVGIMLAEMDEILAETKLDFDIFYAEMAEKKRKELTSSTSDSKGNVKINKPTLDEVEYSVLLSPEYKVKKRNLIRIQKERDIINSLYWAIKDKCEKLNKLSEKLRPEDFEKELLEDNISGIMIKIQNKAII